MGPLDRPLSTPRKRVTCSDWITSSMTTMGVVLLSRPNSSTRRCSSPTTFSIWHRNQIEPISTKVQCWTKHPLRWVIISRWITIWWMLRIFNNLNNFSRLAGHTTKIWDSKETTWLDFRAKISITIRMGCSSNIRPIQLMATHSSQRWEATSSKAAQNSNQALDQTASTQNPNNQGSTQDEDFPLPKNWCRKARQALCLLKIKISLTWDSWICSKMARQH